MLSLTSNSYSLKSSKAGIYGAILLWPCLLPGSCMLSPSDCKKYKLYHTYNSFLTSCLLPQIHTVFLVIPQDPETPQSILEWWFEYLWWYVNLWWHRKTVHWCICTTILNIISISWAFRYDFCSNWYAWEWTSINNVPSSIIYQ